MIIINKLENEQFAKGLSFGAWPFSFWGVKFYNILLSNCFSALLGMVVQFNCTCGGVTQTWSVEVSLKDFQPYIRGRAARSMWVLDQENLTFFLGWSSTDAKAVNKIAAFMIPLKVGG